MLKHPQLTLQRIQLFATQRGLAGKLYKESAPVGLSVFHAPDRIPYAEAVQGAYRPAQVGEQYGPFWSTHWFRVEIQIPTTWAGKEVHFLWDSSSEGEVYLNGEPMQGLTGHAGRLG
jgi:alpha-mannosidase